MHPETNLTMGRVLARAWSDPEFKTRLLAGPKAALRELGIGLPDGLDIVARENYGQDGASRHQCAAGRPTDLGMLRDPRLRRDLS